MFDVKLQKKTKRCLAESLLIILALGAAVWGEARPSAFTTTQHRLLRHGRPFFWLGDTGWMLMTIHPIYTSSRDFHEDPWLDFNMQQTWGGAPANVGRILTDYRKRPPKPVLNGEPGYENRAETPSSSAWKCRYEGYWSVFSGGFGFTYGADRVWQFHLEWQDALQ